MMKKKKKNQSSFSLKTASKSEQPESTSDHETRAMSAPDRISGVLPGQWEHLTLFHVVARIGLFGHTFDITDGSSVTGLAWLKNITDAMPV